MMYKFTRDRLISIALMGLLQWHLSVVLASFPP